MLVNSSPEGLVGRRGWPWGRLGEGQRLSPGFQVQALEPSTLSGSRGPQLQALLGLWQICAVPDCPAVPVLTCVAQAERMAHSQRKSTSSRQKHFRRRPTRKTEYSGHFILFLFLFGFFFGGGVHFKQQMECSELVLMVKDELRSQLEFFLPLALWSPPLSAAGRSHVTQKPQVWIPS